MTGKKNVEEIFFSCNFFFVTKTNPTQFLSWLVYWQSRKRRVFEPRLHRLAMNMPSFRTSLHPRVPLALVFGLWNLGSISINGFLKEWQIPVKRYLDPANSRTQTLDLQSRSTNTVAATCTEQIGWIWIGSATNDCSMNAMDSRRAKHVNISILIFSFTVIQPKINIYVI